MQIEAGKFYKTADGRKVGPMSRWDDTCSNPWEVLGGTNEFDSGGDIWRNDGTSAHDCPDLIAEWSEPAAARKPNVGDRVRVLDGAAGSARDHIGETVEIVDICCRSNGFLVLYFGNNWPLIDGEWEFAPDAAPEFKAGDRVVNVNDDDPCRDITIGKTYVLTYAGGETVEFLDDVGDLRTRNAENYAIAPANPDATSVAGDIVEIVADRYAAVSVGSLGRVTASSRQGRHVRMCDDGLSYVFALDEIAKTSKQPEFEYEAGDDQAAVDAWDFGVAVDAYTDDLRDDIAAETLAQIIDAEGADICTATKHAATAYAYADAMIAARAA